MKKIILISDTHGFIPDSFWKYIGDADELWHAGDVGNIEIIDSLKEKISVKGVYGNIDGDVIRKEFKEYRALKVQGVKILMLHIGGKPYKYTEEIGDCKTDYYPQIICNDCGVTVEGESYPYKDDNRKEKLEVSVIEAWNTRIPIKEEE